MIFGGTPFARTHATAAIQAANATSSVHLTVREMEPVVEQMATRLSRLEHSHSSLAPTHRRRQGGGVMSAVVQFVTAADHALETEERLVGSGRPSR